MKTIQLISKLSITKLNKIIRRPFIIFLYFFNTTLYSIVSIIFIPPIFSLGLVITSIVFAAVSITYMTISVEFNNSTLKKNINIGGSERNIVTGFSDFIICLFMAIACSIFSIILITIASKLNMLSGEIITIGEHSVFYNFTTFFPLFFIYNIFLLSILSFSILELYGIFTNKLKMFSLFVLTVLIINFIYGGFLNNYFYLSDSNNNFNNPSFRRLIMPKYMYYFSLLNPFYAQSQMISAIYGSINKLDWSFNGTETPWIWTSINNYSNGAINNGNFPGWKWNIFWIVPYIDILILWVTKAIIKK